MRSQFTPLLLLTGLALCCCPLAAAQSSASAASGEPANVVDITAVDYAFRAPDAIPAGWTTLRFTNEGEEPHFVYLTRIPDDKSLHEYETDLSSLFNEAWVAIREGRVDVDAAYEMVFAGLPEWYAETQVIGGPGLSAAGRTSEITLHLEPGRYIAECYVKNEDGTVHYMEGMLREIMVTGDFSDAAPPTPDATLTLSNYDMDIDGELRPGRRVLAVHVAENPEQGFGHSVHVARLDADTDIEDVVDWMNWFNVDGLRTPAPATFIGGAHPMATGTTAYLTLDLEPGRYLFLSEETGARGVIREVTIAP